MQSLRARWCQIHRESLSSLEYGTGNSFIPAQKLKRAWLQGSGFHRSLSGTGYRGPPSFVSSGASYRSVSDS